ncbi:MAG: Fic family protein [Campylobacterota bacterium]|nr:Fic family protein [Campylobacterota bacterium]
MIIAFQNEILPKSCKLIGYSWLIDNFNLDLPLRKLSCVSQKRLASQTIQAGKWIIFDTQLMVEDTPYHQLEFAIKHETLDLLVLKNILQAFNEYEVSKNIKANPRRILNKKIWFLYEFLLAKTLPIEDLPTGKYDNLLNEKNYIVSPKPIKSKRHKINNNLIGTKNICPIILRTKPIQSYLDTNLTDAVSSVIDKVSKALVRRAASFLLLSDSKASFEIEGERVPKNRIENWGKIINEAGKKDLDINEIERLHTMLLNDSRFIKIGLRDEEVFLGDRDRDNYPIPEFIGAKSKDLPLLIENWLELEQKLINDEVNPILHAVIIAFSFVYIHPLEDGNGRIHRYLMHHVLAKRNFYPKGMIFPISTVILDEIEKYHEILTGHSSPLMKMIEWEATENGNVEVLNETQDLYRYFDCTSSCEFIFKCVEKTITKTLPNELQYLTSFDKTYDAINEYIEMPDNKIKSLITFILQNNYKLSKAKRGKYYSELSDKETTMIEEIARDNFQ